MFLAPAPTHKNINKKKKWRCSGEKTNKQKTTKGKNKKSKLLRLCLLGLILLPRRGELVSVNCNTSELLLNLPHLSPVSDLSTESSGCEWQRRRTCGLCFYGQIVSLFATTGSCHKNLCGFGSVRWVQHHMGPIIEYICSEWH